MRISFFRRRVQIACISASTLILAHCSKSSSSDPAAAAAASTTTTTTTTTTSTTGDSSSITSVNALALAYPSSLSVSIFPQTGSTSLALGETTDTTTLPPLADAPKVESFKKKEAAADEILKGSGDSCLPQIFQQQLMDQAVTCYQFDQDMMYGTQQGTQYAGTKNGLDSTGESCLVSFARSQVSTVNAIVDQALGFVQAMMCQAKKSGSAKLPDVGESLDLSTEIGTAMGSYASTVTKASISRLKDQNGQPVYRSDVALAMKMNQGGADKTLTTEMHLVHSPVSETSNDTYTGKLWVKRAGAAAASQQGGQQDQNPVDNYLSVSYSKVKEADASYRLVAELRRAQLASAFSDLAFANGVLDLNAGASLSVPSTDPAYGSYINPTTKQPIQNTNNAIAGIMYVAFNVNPADNTGTVSYWQNPGGSYQENARGMVFNLSADADTGLLKGCGLSGATGNSTLASLSIRQFTREGKTLGRTLQPNGFYHPFFNNENVQTGCTAAGPLTDSTGAYYSQTCTLGGNTQVAKWYKPNFSNVTSNTALQTAADNWVTKQHGDYVTKQCVVQGTDGLYAIDTALITPSAGYELVKGDTSVSAPDLSEMVDVDVVDP